jgi:hypothetical protein
VAAPSWGLDHASFSPADRRNLEPSLFDDIATRTRTNNVVSWVNTGHHPPDLLSCCDGWWVRHLLGPKTCHFATKGNVGETPWLGQEQEAKRNRRIEVNMTNMQ